MAVRAAVRLPWLSRLSMVPVVLLLATLLATSTVRIVHLYSTPCRPSPRLYCSSCPNTVPAQVVGPRGSAWPYGDFRCDVTLHMCHVQFHGTSRNLSTVSVSGLYPLKSCTVADSLAYSRLAGWLRMAARGVNHCHKNAANEIGAEQDATSRSKGEGSCAVDTC